MLTPGQDPAAGESPNTFRVFLTIVHAWNGWKNMCSPMCGGLGTRFVNFRRLRCLAEKSVRGGARTARRRASSRRLDVPLSAELGVRQVCVGDLALRLIDVESE